MSALQSLVRPAHGSWRGRWRACRGCGSTRVGELADGYCQDCFADTFGPLGLDDIPPIEEETMDDHAPYDLPSLPTRTVTLVAPPAPQTHRCAKCKADKPLDAFSASMLAKSPGSCWCKACVAASKVARRQKHNNGTQSPASTPPPPAATAVRSVADELRALLDALATERAALLEEQERLTARLADLSTQCDAVQTTIALVSR